MRLSWVLRIFQGRLPSGDRLPAFDFKAAGIAAQIDRETAAAGALAADRAVAVHEGNGSGRIQPKPDRPASA